MPRPPHILPFNTIHEKSEELAAAQLLGAVWNWCLYGALVVQIYVYSYNFPRDNRYVKLLVYSIFILETLQTVLSGADLYHWFAAGFGNIDQLTVPFTFSIDVPIMGSVVSLGVQFFFVYRIFVLSEKRPWLLGVVICLLSIVSALGAFALGIFSYISDGFMEGLSLEVFEMTWILGNTLSDLLIASAMLYHLRRIWARDGNLSRHILVSIVRLTVETNLVTTTVSIVALLMVALYPERNWYACPYVSNFISINSCHGCHLINLMIQITSSTALIYSGSCIPTRFSCLLTIASRSASRMMPVEERSHEATWDHGGEGERLRNSRHCMMPVIRTDDVTFASRQTLRSRSH